MNSTQPHGLDGPRPSSRGMIGAALARGFAGLDWLRQQLKRDPKVIDHVLVSDDRVVLTG